MSNLQELFRSMPQKGTVEWIGLRPAKRATIEVVNTVTANAESGLEGDRYSGKSGKRQVTLIQAEHLQVVGGILKKEIDPALLRRNIVVSGINLLGLKEQQFKIGDEVILETTGHCHPCSRMEENLGAGGYNAMRGHGGITARVIQGGAIRKGDKVQLFLQND